MEYEPGWYMVVSDALSRAPLAGKCPEVVQNEVDFYVHSIVSSLPISDGRLEKFRSETEKDRTLQKLKEYVMYGWPQKRLVDGAVMPYYSFREEIVYHEGLLFKGERIIVPISLRQEVKFDLHTGHIGIECCKRRARRSVYWPGLNKEITDLVSNSNECITYSNKQSNETFIKHEIPGEPWVKVATDLLTIYGKNYIIVVDYFSKYFVIASVDDPMDSPAVIKELKKVFSKLGIPKMVFSDNGPQYDSHEFAEFAKEWHFEHQT